MQRLVRRLGKEDFTSPDHQDLLFREWLVTNGLGGYASGTIAGIATRRYHGLLVAAHPAPLGRRMMLAHLSERIRLPDGTTINLSGEPYQPGHYKFEGAEYLTEFRLEMGLPVWRYDLGELGLERYVILPHEQNTVYVIYRLVSGADYLRLKLMPSLHNRSHDDPVSTPLPEKVRLAECDGRFEFSLGDSTPPLKMVVHGPQSAFTVERQTVPEVLYPVEENRGYDFRGQSWSPGYFRVDLRPGELVALVASTESWEVIGALTPQDALRAECERRKRCLTVAGPAACSGLAGELVLAADQFIIKPVGRTEDAARLQAEGNEVRTVIAGYHWFTDWGRDTMISLEGLTLCTGRLAEAGYILRLFAYYIRDGLLPNLFPEGEKEGLYHTADATLWFFHAIQRYLEYTEDFELVESLLPRLRDIINRHVHGTRFGIGVDPEDGLLRQGEPGYQLTWMDAKVDDWVITPRRGKAVEINALWYNALVLLSHWLHRADDKAAAEELLRMAQQTKESFNRRFWYDAGGYLYDVVDGEAGDDPACRPNQILAVALEHPVLEKSRWETVVRTVQQRLVTPVGLRTLAPGHTDYRPRYFGDLRTRDAAYHQGTVWAWLIGPFIDAWLKVYPDRLAEARSFLTGFDAHLSEACIGTISEIFDAEAPYHPRGCVSQAWSVAEVLRCWIKTEPA